MASRDARSIARPRRNPGENPQTLATVPADGLSPMPKHLKNRTLQVLAADAAADDDELLPTKTTAEWLGVSLPWLEIGRSKGYGPPYVRLGPNLIRYRRGDVRAYLRRCTHKSTREYDDHRRDREGAAR
jgi:predicted DNA-binding transcriptional regulator AlpA